MGDNRYIVLRINRVWGVSDNDTKQLEGEPYLTQEAAEDRAAELNFRVWRDARPDAPDSFVDTGGDVSDRLLEILDKMHGDLGLWSRAA